MDWIAASLSLLSAYIIGKKHWSGWFIGGVGATIWVWIAMEHKLYGMACINLLLGGAFIGNGISWFYGDKR